MSNPNVISTDVGRLVGLVGPGAWALYALYVTTYTLIAGFGGGAAMTRPPGIAALLIVFVAGAIVAASSPTPLERWRLSMVLAAVVASTALGNWGLPTAGAPDFLAWYLGANSFLLFAVALRARVLGAWLGMALMVAVTVTWSVLATGTIWRGVEVVYGQPVSLLAGTIFSLGLHVTARRITEFNAAQERAIAVETHEAARKAHRREQLEQLHRLSEPTLRAIAAGTATQADRSEVEVLEATLRDQIRAGALVGEPLSSVVLRLRRAGADVLLLDDIDGDHRVRIDQAVQELREWAADQLRELDVDEVTVRVRRVGDEYVCTVTAGDLDLSSGPKSLPVTV